MLSETEPNKVKLVDFGLSRKIRRDSQTFGTMGAPEFVAPEIVLQQPISLSSDMWSVGVLAYVMLSGKSPFLGDSDKDTLNNVMKGEWKFDPSAFGNVSSDAKDFIQKLLILNPKDRLGVNLALGHPWIKAGAERRHGEVLSTKDLKEFKYRHQWVERRIFMQSSGEEEGATEMRSPRNAMEWLEPHYFPPPTNQLQRPADLEVSATIPKRGFGAQEADALIEKTLKKAEKEADESMADLMKDRKTAEQLLDPSVYVQGEWRPIEEEIANRILSDISEEESDEENVEGPPGFNTASLQGPAAKNKNKELSGQALMDRLGQLPGAGEAPVNGVDQLEDGEKTPTQDQMDRLDAGGKLQRSESGSKTGAPVVMQGLHQLHIEIGGPVSRSSSRDMPSPTSSGSCGKSPVRLSPSKEAVMEVIIAMAKKDEEEARSETASDRPSDKDGKDKAKSSGDPEFERLMAEVNQLKTDFHKRRKEILDGDGDGKGPRKQLDFQFPSREEMEMQDYEWDSQYQTGPETYLLSTRDPGLCSRVRDYRRVLFGDSAVGITGGLMGWRNMDIMVRERRRYSDMMREDLGGGQAKGGIQKSMSSMDPSKRVGAVRRVQSDFQLAPPPAITCFKRKDGPHAPVFHSRIKETAFVEDSVSTFQALVLGEPRPSITWFQNETPLAPNPRYQMSYEGNRASLQIKGSHLGDAGFYTCTATNDLGSTSCSARLRTGDIPERPSRPDVMLASDNEIFMTWDPPSGLRSIEILSYKLEFRKAGAEDWSSEWVTVAEDIEEEAAVVKHLEPMGIYQFRVVAKNQFGFGEPSLSSRILRTHPKGAPKLNIELLKEDHHLKVVFLPRIKNTSVKLSGIPEMSESKESSVARSETGGETSTSQLGGPNVELSTEDPQERFQLQNELFRGRFCIVRDAVDKKSEMSSHSVAKIILASPDQIERAKREFDILRQIKHENFVTLFNAYLRDEFLVLIEEKLPESLLERFTYNDSYTEEQVAKTVLQILGALDWLHFCGIVHLNLQPDNVMFAARRKWDVKLIDFGSALQLSSESVQRAPELSNATAWTAPELLQDGAASTVADIWNLGLITYMLMSGFHPFESDEDTVEEVRSHIIREKLDINFIHSNASQEALRFLTWCLTKEPKGRMRPEEGLEHRWLSPSDPMVRRRENIRFSSNRVRVFAREYFKKKTSVVTQNNQLLSAYGPKIQTPE